MTQVTLIGVPMDAGQRRAGCVMGPAFYLLDANSSLLTTGVVAGTLAYALDRKWLRPKPVEVSA